MQNILHDTVHVPPLFDLPILIRGSGDLGSGVVYRLLKAGFPVVIAELEKPLLVRPTVSYGAAVFRGQTEVEGIAAKRVTVDEALTQLSSGKVFPIPVVIDPDGKLLSRLKPPVV